MAPCREARALVPVCFATHLFRPNYPVTATYRTFSWLLFTFHTSSVLIAVLYIDSPQRKFCTDLNCFVVCRSCDVLRLCLERCKTFRSGIFVNIGVVTIYPSKRSINSSCILMKKKKNLTGQRKTHRGLRRRCRRLTPSPQDRWYLLRDQKGDLVAHRLQMSRLH